jgi:hypothetical protein
MLGYILIRKKQFLWWSKFSFFNVFFSAEHTLTAHADLLEQWFPTGVPPAPSKCACYFVFSPITFPYYGEKLEKYSQICMPSKVFALWGVYTLQVLAFLI